MGSDDTAFPQSVVHELEVRLLEEALGRALRVGGVGDDDIESVLVVIKELETIADVDFDLGVLVPSGHAGEVLLGETDDSLYIISQAHTYTFEGKTYLVNVAENSLLNTLVLDDLAEDTAVTATDDQYLLGVGVRHHGEMRDHLLVGELIPLSALDDVVQNQHNAMVRGLKDQHILILALLVVQDLLDS